jgi:CDP-glycerol glycerophosphotransferase (TagB/SpsB family)
LVTHLYLGGNTKDSGTIFSRLLVVFFTIINKIIKVVGLSKFKDPPKQYFQNILGLYNIRFMYGADAGGVKFGEYNNLFDIIFCHRPRDSGIIKKKFDRPVFEMGYPRYDNYFKNINNQNLKNTILKKFSCSNNKVTVLWIPTVSEYFSTIETYAKSIQKITDRYNVILRPHPLEIDPQYSRYNQKVFDIVNSGAFIINRNPYQDMSELYLIADYVFCDYGGTIFSALYVEKNILLLNHKDVHMDHGVYGSTSMEVREFLPSINDVEADSIDEYLSDPKFWSKVKQKNNKARRHYFGSSKGNSSKLVGDEFMSIFNRV